MDVHGTKWNSSHPASQPASQLASQPSSQCFLNYSCNKPASQPPTQPFPPRRRPLPISFANPTIPATSASPDPASSAMYQPPHATVTFLDTMFVRWLLVKIILFPQQIAHAIAYPSRTHCILHLFWLARVRALLVIFPFRLASCGYQPASVNYCIVSEVSVG